PAIRGQIRRIEEILGRRRVDDRFAPRCIDLDLVLMGDRTFASPELILPAPDIESRAFVAVPLADIAPDFRHPAWHGRSLAEIAATLHQDFHHTLVDL
nr:2-amino-4-hydroxy-6-hydroxymethyldihydropteridine diphosphokinase [bacterium]